MLLFLDRTLSLRIRGYYSLWQGIPAHFCSEKGYSPPHLPHCCQCGIRFDLTGFQSLLLTGSHCFLFHSLIRCFISGGSCTLTCTARSQDRRLRASPLGVSPLAAWPCGLQPSHPLCGVANISQNSLTIKYYRNSPDSTSINKSCHHFIRIAATIFHIAGHDDLRHASFSEIRRETEHHLVLEISHAQRSILDEQTSGNPYICPN